MPRDKAFFGAFSAITGNHFFQLRVHVLACFATVLSIGFCGVPGHSQMQSDAIPPMQHFERTASGQIATGQWQGEFDNEGKHRVLLVLQSGTNGNERQGAIYLLDEDRAEWPHALTTFKQLGEGVRFTIENLGIEFVGTIQGGAINGHWTGREGTVPLTLEHANDETSWKLPSAGKAMPSSATPYFEVATIKPVGPDEHDSGIMMVGSRLRIVNKSMEELLAIAYGVHRVQIVNSPSWFSQRWMIEGIPNTPGEPSVAQIRHMILTLLVDRLALKVRGEQRMIPAYIITIGKDGPKMTRSQVENSDVPDSTGTFAQISDMRFTNTSMSDFAEAIGMDSDRPIVNKTGLAGRWDFRLHWAAPDVTPSDSLPPVLATALQEQVGLRLEAKKVLMSVYIVEVATEPSSD